MIFVFLVFSANNNEHILPKCRIIVGLHFLKLYISKRALKKKKKDSLAGEEKECGIFLREKWKDTEDQVQTKS